MPPSMRRVRVERTWEGYGRKKEDYRVIVSEEGDAVLVGVGYRASRDR